VLANVFENGAVYYTTILGVPILVGVLLGLSWPSRRALWILAAVVLAFVLFDFAVDETRSEDVPFFVVLALFMFGLGALARWLARRVAPARAA
jgi:hypothetical protein